MIRAIKYGLIIVGSFLFLALVAGLWFLQSGAFDYWARGKLIEFLEDRFEVRVEIDRLRIGLLANRVELTGLRIFSGSLQAGEPAIALQRIRLDFSITQYIRPAGTLDRLELDGLRLRILEDENDRLNLLNMFAPRDRPPGEEPFSFTKLAIRHILIQDGLIVFKDHTILLTSSEGGFHVELRYDAEQRGYEGLTQLAEMNLDVNGFAMEQASAEVHFLLEDQRLLIHSVRVEAQELDLQAQGEFVFKDVAYEFETEGRVDLVRLREPDLTDLIQRGELHLLGTFSGRGGEFQYTGRATSPIVRFLNLSFVQIDSKLEVNRDRVLVEPLITRFHGGPVQVAGRLGLRDDEPSAFQVEAKSVALESLLKELQLEAFQIRGRGNYSGRVEWPALEWQQLAGTGRTTYSGEFGGVPPDEERTPSEVPFEGAAGVILQGTGVLLRGGELLTPAGKVDYSGEVGFDAAYAFEVEMDTREIQEFLDIAEWMGLSPQPLLSRYPLELGGGADLTARIMGRGEHFELSGQAGLHQVGLSGYELGAFTSRFHLDPMGLRLEQATLRDRDFELVGQVVLPFDGTEARVLEISAVAENLPIERFLPLLERELPLQGRVSGRIDLREAKPGRFVGAGSLQVAEPGAYGERFDRLSTRIEFEDSTVRLEEMELSVGPGKVTGQAEADLETRRFKIDLESSGLRLEHISSLQQRFPASGPVDFKLRGEGDFQEPNLELQLHSPEIRLREHYRLADFALQAIVRQGTARFSARQRFVENEFTIEGELELQAPYPVQASLKLDQIPIRPYLDLLDLEEPPDLDGSISGTAVISGPIAEFESIRGKAQIESIEVTIVGEQIRNRDPIQMAFSDGQLDIQPVVFIGRETEFQIGGSVVLREPQSVNLRVDGSLNLEIGSGLIPQTTIAGEMLMETVISGPLRAPRIVGEAELLDGFLVHPDFPTTVSEAEGTFKFTANQVSIDTFSARTRYGTVNAEGGIFLEGFTPSRWRINVFGYGLRLEYPENVISTLDIDIDFLKSERSQLVSGAIYVRSADYVKDVSIPELILQYTSAQAAAVAPVTPEEIVLDVTVEAYQTLRITNNLADVVASGDFTVRGTVENPVLLGSLTIDEGELFLEGNQYEIVRGSITFNNPRRTMPVFNFEAETDVREFTVTISMRGPLEQLNLNFRSDPPLPTGSIISLLAIGETQEAFEQQEAGALAVFGAGALLSRSVGERLGTQTGRFFGFERFSIDPFLAGGRDTGARITLGKQVTRDLSVTFVNELSNNEQGQIVIVEYQLASWLTAIGTRERDGSIAVDFKFKKRF